VNKFATLYYVAVNDFVLSAIDPFFYNFFIKCPTFCVYLLTLKKYVAPLLNCLDYNSFSELMLNLIIICFIIVSIFGFSPNLLRCTSLHLLDISDLYKCNSI